MNTEEVADQLRAGICPYCGTMKGGARGPQIRTRTKDVFCHACRKSWPEVMNPEALGEMALFLNHEEDLRNQVAPVEIVASPDSEELPRIAAPERPLVIKVLVWIGRRLVRH